MWTLYLADDMLKWLTDLHNKTKINFEKKKLVKKKIAIVAFFVSVTDWLIIPFVFLTSF